MSNLNTLEEFVRRFHQREVRDGQIREILYNLISKIEENDEVEEEEDRIVYRIVSTTTVPHHRSARANDLIVHCRCGSVQDETSLVQCYACQVKFPEKEKKTQLRSTLIRFHLALATCQLCFDR